MNQLNIRFREILSHGRFIRGDYFLVCHGYKQSNQVVKIQTYFSLSHALQSTSHQDSDSSSIIYITPLREWTTLKIQALIKAQYVDIYMYIDLKKNSISLEVIPDQNIVLSDTQVAMIVSCFGIKQGNRVLYFKNFHRIKAWKKQTTEIRP
ncbi:hypothetical protein [Heyndrickxia camelliae]|uniref:Uncharacterized protein n=1 Tax=Heyndrickxia camelliae TaxID=1707093 RepID=A0A2N3LGM1_9BACI|nr:hypothetical protein [Heyndrickxia camelliae]PKR83780.1 hypothetical protein CWO92_17370 [Heyndrickxia camelliae]